ncbi:hypothetical protein CFC21_100558 [Triticum aestivum]|uniref:Uncharacterized protein n=2 Tax=Triticum aestivum TaxID=4565 RepID=A0A9R1M1C5_WHEAT|nr:disease resistance protein Pik-2-like [Triticum aestivum]KAF7098851.1 hypothetical protein CFC21_100558 [Triticum aestivum]
MEGTAQLVSTVGLRVGEEFGQLRRVGRDVAELRDELATMNAILRMHSEADEGDVDHFVREWMKQVQELAYDSEDCIHLYIFRIRCRRSDGLVAWSKRVLATLFPRHRLAGDIKNLRARAVAISERHARYGVSREALRRSPSLAFAPTPPAASSSPSALGPANDPGHLVGIIEQANILGEKVKAVDDQERDMKLKVFSIVGFGGVGKTTLALEACRQLESEFQRQAQVSVSQIFNAEKDMEGLLQRVIQQIVKPKANNEEGINVEESPQGNMTLKEQLESTLQDKRYLIVIDDVWTIAAWDAILANLPENHRGSRILVTTRIATVAKACSNRSEYIYPIEPLNSEDSKRLFLSRTFPSVGATCPDSLKVAMQDILRKCGGLPLAIVSIASFLRNYNSPDGKDMWERVSKSIGSHMESQPSLERMRQIVTLSYNHLPHDIRCCMMYLSIFPEDYAVNMHRLLHKWIAEGLVAEVRGLTLLEVAQAYYEELLSRNMIVQAAEEVRNEVSRETCRVHDMVLEVMVSKSLEANFVSLIGGPYEGMAYDKIRRLSIHGEEEESVDLTSKKKGVRNIEMEVKHVRSLSMFNNQGHHLLDRLGEFTLLRVLDLDHCKGLQNKHMGDICRLYLLRYLSMRETNVSVMPPEIGKLEQLLTLDARGTLLEGLPETVIKLLKLERLFFSSICVWEVLWTPPRGVSKMKALREVIKIGISDDIEVVKEIGKLQQMQLIHIFVKRSVPSEEVLRELAVSLSKIYSMRSLNIGQIGNTANTLDFLHYVSPPRLIRKIWISGSMGGLPSWIGSLTYLEEIELLCAFLVDDQLFEILCESPNLKSIILHRNFWTRRELVARTAHKFMALRSLHVSLADEFPEVLRFEQGAMTSLESLSLHIGDNNNNFDGIEHLTNLKEVHLSGGRDYSAMKLALDMLKAENERRHSEVFKITVRY